MRQIRIHVDAPLRAGEVLRLPEQAGTHVTRVLRLRAGDPITLFDGQGGEGSATLLESGRNGAVVRVATFAVVERESPLQVTLLQGVARGERMDTVIQKATELGVSRIVPVSCEFSVVRLDAATMERRLAHWRAVAIAACEP